MKFKYIILQLIFYYCYYYCLFYCCYHYNLYYYICVNDNKINRYSDRVILPLRLFSDPILQFYIRMFGFIKGSTEYLVYGHWHSNISRL